MSLPQQNKENKENQVNPSIHPGRHHHYNPKREANAENRDETTGLDTEAEPFDDDLSKQDFEDEEYRDQSGAI